MKHALWKPTKWRVADEKLCHSIRFKLVKVWETKVLMVTKRYKVKSYRKNAGLRTVSEGFWAFRVSEACFAELQASRLSVLNNFSSWKSRSYIRSEWFVLHGRKNPVAILIEWTIDNVKTWRARGGEKVHLSFQSTFEL